MGVALAWALRDALAVQEAGEPALRPECWEAQACWREQSE